MFIGIIFGKIITFVMCILSFYPVSKVLGTEPSTTLYVLLGSSTFAFAILEVFVVIRELVSEEVKK